MRAKQQKQNINTKWGEKMLIKRKPQRGHIQPATLPPPPAAAAAHATCNMQFVVADN